MAVHVGKRLTPKQYLARERASETKHEYLDSEVFAMTGASRKHNLITGNIFAELHAQFKRRPCTVFASDMRLKVAATGLYTYPDISVVCGEAQLEDEHQDTLLNPTLIVEVLSKSTANYDRGEKFEHYRKLPTLQEYVLVAQDRCHVARYMRQADAGWLLLETDNLQDTVELPSIGCRLTLAEVYDRVIVVVK